MLLSTLPERSSRSVPDSIRSACLSLESGAVILPPLPDATEAEREYDRELKEAFARLRRHNDAEIARLRTTELDILDTLIAAAAGFRNYD